MALQRDKIVGNAEKLVARGKIEPAIREYERLLAENPNDVNTLNRIGDLWVRIERNDEAVKVFRKIADHYARDGFFLKAIAIFKKINKLDPSKLDIYAKLAELYAKQGLAMEAKSQYMVLADYYVKHTDLESAVGIYLKIAELDPHSVNVRIKLADLYTQNNQTPEALKEYDRVGRMLLKRGMSAEAVQVFRKALKIDSGNVDLAESVVTALLEEKEYDNAVQIVQSALGSNKENPRLIVLMSRVHLARGDAGSARGALQQGLGSNPSDFGIRQSLAELHLREGDADQAVELISPVLSVALDKSEGRNAVDILERIVAAKPDHAAALEKLIAVYRRLDDDSNAIAAMIKLGDAHMARREYQQAEVIFRDLARLEPENAHHRDRLAELAQETGSAAPELESTSLPEEPELLLDFSDSLPDPAEPEIAAAEPPTPLPPVISSPGKPEPEELEEETIDLDFPSDESEVESGFGQTPSEETLAAVERDQKEANEVLEFITEHLTEADVFAKYGLYDKAIEHLQTVLGKAPRHRPAYEKLLKVYMNEGQAAQIRETANRYIALLRIEGDLEEAEAVEQEIWNRGYTTGSAPEPDDAAGAVAPSIEIHETAGPAILLTEEVAPMDEELRVASAAIEEEPLEIEFESRDFQDPVPDRVAVAASSSEPLPEETIVILDESAEIEEPAAASSGEEPLAAEIAAETVAEEWPETLEATVGSSQGELAVEIAAKTVAEESIQTPGAIAELDEPIYLTDEPEETIDLPEFEIEETDPAVAESLEDQTTPPSDARESIAEETIAAPEQDPFESSGIMDSFPGDFAVSPSVEDLGELDFYIEQELLEEAGNKLETLSAQFPMHADIQLRQEKLHAARARIAGTIKAYESVEPDRRSEAVHPPALSHDDIENELIAALPHESDEEDEAIPEPLSSTPAPEPLSDEDEDLFAAEDDFFDLAAELGEDLAEEDDELSDMGDDEQSLEQIFREFKKGVEQQLDSEDYDTHYNLGIAYKEMGLIDEAIGEFQLASKDPHRAIDGCSMLGLCFLEKGMPQLAIKWYNKGLEMPEISEEEHMGLLYDLGAAYLEVGDIDAAHKAFIEVYGINSKYRDIVGRIKQLEDVRRAT